MYILYRTHLCLVAKWLGQPRLGVRWRGGIFFFQSLPADSSRETKKWNCEHTFFIWVQTITQQVVRLCYTCSFNHMITMFNLIIVHYRYSKYDQLILLYTILDIHVLGHHGVVSFEAKVIGKCKFCCLYVNKSTKERCMFKFLTTYCFSAVE